ncbi:MAG: zinc ribbon domain-containing protein [Candidatus Rokubacteria bacterium]|nr:zinc ribbon domain-containing protein [Candidatus Rokubacteria bacterium]
MIACPRCQHQNPADAAFCQECRSRLEAPCLACSATTPAMKARSSTRPLARE